MLSDEEKQAIKEIKSFNQYNWELNNLKTKKIAKPYFDSLDTILNLIQKQEKEIEELDSENEVLEEIKISYEKKTDKLLKEKVEREKEIKDIYKMLTVEKEKNINLINTNKKLYEMGQQNAIQKLINKDYVSENKIKAKIEEVEQWELYNMKIPKLSTLDERLGAKIGIKYVLQSLLEKE